MQLESFDEQMLVSELYKLKFYDWGGDYKIVWTNISWIALLKFTGLTMSCPLGSKEKLRGALLATF
jgi:hypothetical protein